MNHSIRHYINLVEAGSRKGGGPNPAVLKGLKNWISDEVPGLVGAWLFGSRAAGMAQPDSDYDILVATTETNPNDIEEIRESLSGEWYFQPFSDKVVQGTLMDFWVVGVEADKPYDWADLAPMAGIDTQLATPKPAIRFI